MPPARAATKCLEYEDVHDLVPSKSLEKANKYLKKAKSGPPFGSSRKNQLYSSFFCLTNVFLAQDAASSSTNNLLFLGENGIGITSLAALQDLLKEAETELASVDFRLSFHNRHHFSVAQQVEMLKSQIEASLIHYHHHHPRIPRLFRGQGSKITRACRLNKS